MKLIGFLQLILAGILFMSAAGTLVNMVFIAFRPETISVVNVLIGQTLLIVCMAALGRILLRKGQARLGSGPAVKGDDESPAGS